MKTLVIFIIALTIGCNLPEREKIIKKPCLIYNNPGQVIGKRLCWFKGCIIIEKYKDKDHHGTDYFFIFKSDISQHEELKVNEQIYYHYNEIDTI